ncbi:class I SAM-dependent methyltransferase [Streptomyces monticola]|uniref:Class I SAM-dependent methyltransferase n=1 Tax=Streptomyces monticola TaxID=2666263 RepID=A0ABW2JBI2_9ACTN
MSTEGATESAGDAGGGVSAPLIDYTAEAAVYDETRGGVPRAAAAAAAVLSLVPPGAGTLLDVACGTGLVTERLARPGLRVTGTDRAHGMARTAVGRLPGAVVLGDSRQLPFGDAVFDAVTAVWLLHLVPEAEQIVAECARVLRPGGVLVTTVDKDAGHDVGCDIDALLAPHLRPEVYDRADLVEAHARARGLTVAGEARFTGHGQGRTPRRTAWAVREGRYAARLALSPAGTRELADRIDALPDPGLARPEPRFRVLGLRKGS